MIPPDEVVKQIVNRKVDAKWILIAILTLGIVYLLLDFNSVPRDRDREVILSNRVDSLLNCIDVLQAASLLDKDTIRINTETIKYIYKVKTKDSIRLAEMTIDDNVTYFKDYVDSYNPVKSKGDTVTIDGSYIQGANSLFLDRDVRIEQVTLLEDNIAHMESIEGRCNEQLSITTKLCNTKLEIKDADTDRLKEKVKKQRKDLLKYKIGSVASLAILVALII